MKGAVQCDQACRQGHTQAAVAAAPGMAILLKG